MPRLLIVRAVFYADIAEALFKGAVEEITRRKAEWEAVEVPGALEIPAAIRIALGHSLAADVTRLHETEDLNQISTAYDGYVALGCVIRGETSHYDIVAGESARGLHYLAVKYALAIGNGILTVENHAQAMARAGVDSGNKGGGAAAACLDLVALHDKFRDRFSR